LKYLEINNTLVNNPLVKDKLVSREMRKWIEINETKNAVKISAVQLK
jgi:hypothetical protein